MIRVLGRRLAWHWLIDACDACVRAGAFAPRIAFGLNLAVLIFGAPSISYGQGCTAGSASPCFQGLGFLPGYASSSASGVSADGLVVVGTGTDSQGNTQAFRWVNGVMTCLKFLPGYVASTASAVSADGSVV